MQLKPCLVQLGKMSNLAPRQTLVGFLVVFVFMTATWAQSDDNMTSRHYYTGTLGKRIAIQMDISVTGEKVSGRYYYDTIGIPMSLSGNLAKIEERDPKNRVTGVFRGTIEPLEKIFEGGWSTPDGKKHLPFKLTKVAEYILSTTRQGKSLEVSALYPHFLSESPAWQQLNEELEESIKGPLEKFMHEGQGRSRAEANGIWSQGVKFLVEYYSDELVSLLADNTEYTGGVYGNYSYQSRNFWIKGNKAIQLKLADLFLPGYEKHLSDYCLKDLRKQEAEYVVNGDIKRFDDNNLTVFSLSPRGLTFSFAHYTVGPRVQGPFSVTIPYKALKGVIDPNGPLKRFSRSK